MFGGFWSFLDQETCFGTSVRVGCGSCELEEGLGMDGKWNMCFHGCKGFLVCWGSKHDVSDVF